jgi:hypothetical protein
MTTTAPAAEIANLRETRAAQTAAKKAHPAGKAAAPAKKAPAKAAAQKAPAKAAKPAGAKLRWALDGERDSKNRVGQTAVASDGAKYVISGAGDAWQATVTSGGKTTVLAEAGYTACYTACVRHHGAKTAA